MYYYSIHYLYGQPEKKGCFAMFEHLPCTWQVTNDKEEALRWFDAAVKSACKSWNGNELLWVRDEKLDYRCIIKQARFVCNEPAYVGGEFIIELNCYTHNPLE